MKISIFTPIHKYNRDFLEKLLVSFMNQEPCFISTTIEWVVALNGDAMQYKDNIVLMARSFDIPLIIFDASEDTGNIGKLKGACCSKATGDILLELDHDDYLESNALNVITQAFIVPEVQFVYSNSVEFLDPPIPGQPNSTIYGAQYGWHNRDHKGYTEMVAFPPVAQYMRRIEWAPNHVRAFRKTAYEAVGGYSQKAVGDDHDLVCRFYIQYGEAGFKHIDKCLYWYRVYNGNTCNGLNRNQEIQQMVDQNYVEFAEQMYLKWAKDNQLKCLDLGGRFNCPNGYQSVDLLEADYIFDLTQSWPLPDNSVGVLRAYHVLEHLRDHLFLNDSNSIVTRNSLIHFFNEAFRVLAPGGFLLIEVPSVSGSGAVSDPTHVRFFNQRSFRYYYDEHLAKFIRPEYKGKFQLARMNEYIWQNTDVSVISCHMIALKEWYDTRWCGERLM